MENWNKHYRSDVQESLDMAELSEALSVVVKDEFSDLTCVKMALKVINDNQSSDCAAFKTAIDYLRIDMDKMRDAETESGRKLYSIVREAVFGD